MFFWLGIIRQFIYNYGNEIIWNNSNIRVENKTIIFKNWRQSGIKYVKDMFDNDRQNFYTFAALKEKFDLPSSDFLKYLSIFNSLPSARKRSLKTEDKMSHQMKNLYKC